MEPRIHVIIAEGEVGEAVARLKEEDGPELQVHGSSDLIQTLFRHGLIEEFRVWIFPIVLGTGKRLFEEGTPPVAQKLVDSQVSSTGVVMAIYEPAGGIPKGSFALEEPTEAELRRRDGSARSNPQAIRRRGIPARPA
jgi:hypothetical protein